VSARGCAIRNQWRIWYRVRQRGTSDTKTKGFLIPGGDNEAGKPNDLKKTRAFFEDLFGWTFQEWGDEYMSFSDGRLDGGFRLAAEALPPGFRLAAEALPPGGVLIVFFSEDLERDVERVQELGATISQEIFSFPGGRRFHFIDPGGTEFAIWGESGAKATSNGVTWYGNSD
jgi:predicted enzyme related to lactoylglutathione lyase